MVLSLWSWADICQPPPLEESVQFWHGHGQLQVAMAFSRRHRSDSVWLICAAFATRKRTASRWPVRAAKCNGECTPKRLRLLHLHLLPAISAWLSPCAAAWCNGVLPHSSFVSGSRGHASNRSRATISLSLDANIICSSSFASGGQNAKTTSWIFTGTGPKTSSSGISPAGPSRKSLCLNLHSLGVFSIIISSIKQGNSLARRQETHLHCWFYLSRNLARVFAETTTFEFTSIRTTVWDGKDSYIGLNFER